MTRLSRRQFLATSAVVAAATGIEGIVATRRAPAYAQGTRLHLLQWSHFVPAADVLFESQAKEFGKQAGVEVAIERINQNDLQTRATAAIQSGAGPDIIILANNHAHLYEASLVDVSDVAEELGRKQGGWYEYAKVNTFASGHWIGVPQFIISWAITYREDWLKEAGFEYPKTWDDFRKVGRALKAKGKPFGQAFGHSINDPNNWCYPLVWMWGGAEVAPDGRSVVLNSKNTLEVVKFNTMLWKEVFDEAAWPGTTATTTARFSQRDLAHRQRAQHLRGGPAEISRRVQGHQSRPLPARPGRRYYWLPAWNSVVMKYSKNQKIAKDFIRFYMDRARFDPYFETMDTFGIPGTQAYRDNPLWKKDPKTAVFPETLPAARQVGHAGPPGRKATEVLSKYIIVDKFAKAIQGMKPEDAVTWASGELKKVYDA
jgi:multiple sugar transport system substrate-binding protein